MPSRLDETGRLLTSTIEGWAEVGLKKQHHLNLLHDMNSFKERKLSCRKADLLDLFPFLSEHRPQKEEFACDVRKG